MTRDSLTQNPPPSTDRTCALCGRTTPAAVEIGYHDGRDSYACPEHATTAVPGPLPYELERADSHPHMRNQ
ncbi:hypothetical protein ABZ714_01175 [Streptomyces sp. NPDC006798]|uniref:hypothetical protein n=1 Tax=Streptomyces sp. NPDC006798 TaxID=3155462 RepID=UPI0033F1FB35